MILITFPHYTSGGLLCDMIDDTMSVTGSNGGLQNYSHNLLKVGKFDSIVQNSIDLAVFEEKFNSCQDAKVAGTHCNPNALPCEWFEKVINITTQTYNSKVYRWARAYYHYYLTSGPWEQKGIKWIDKARSTAKLYLEPNLLCKKPNVINVEFEDIVNSSSYFRNIIKDHSFDQQFEKWKSNNEFLYAGNFHTSEPVIFFKQAEYEVMTGRHFVY
jgi:hypothetical protein